MGGITVLHYDNNDTNATTHVARIDGALYYYDACAKRPDAYDPEVFDYIGVGVIHSVRGVLQGDGDVQRFWRYKARTVLQPDVNVVE